MSGTTPDSVSYPSQPYGLLGPYPWQTVNVQDFGATGDSVTDDAQAFQDALDAIAGTGGTFIIPPAPSGAYLIGRCLRHPSYTTIRGSGAAAVLKGSPSFQRSSDYAGTAMWLNVNSEAAETAFSGYRDFAISFDNVWIDMSAVSNATGATANQGDAHNIAHRAVQGVKITNCRLKGGGSATVSITCDDYLVQGCTAIDQYNCTYDHWGGSTNVRVIGCFARLHVDAHGQIVNFNGIRTGGVHDTETWVSDGFILQGCDLYGDDQQRSINLEALGAGNAATRNIRIIGNKFNNARLIMGGDCKHVVIDANQFINSDGSNSTIWARTQAGDTPEFVQIVGNQFINCVAPAGDGLIDTVAAGTSIVGNSAIGCTYDYAVRFRSAPARGVYLGNTFPGAAIAETLGAFGTGSDIYGLQEQRTGWRTSSGVPAYFHVDNTDTLYLVGVSAGDGPRALFSCAMRNSGSTFQIFPNTSIGGALRKSLGTGLTATGSTRTDAYLIAHDQNEFTTVAAGTGCILRANVGGSDVTIWNLGANTLNVYPVTGNQIDALGVNNPDTIAAGASKRYTAMTASFYRTAP